MLPTPAGGIIDCANRVGGQTFADNPFPAMSLPVTLVLPQVPIDWANALLVPANIVMLFGGSNVDVQTTSTACTTAASAQATCQTSVTDNFGSMNRRTSCSLDDTPMPQTGLPVILRVAVVDANSFTVTIGSWNAQASGGGTLTCWTNTRF
jgi:hypothetical protein